jgi:hypothetical protein
MTMLGMGLPTENLPMPLHIYVVSNTPGRLRFRVPREHRQPETLDAIADTLQAFSSQIQKVRTRAHTGSVTVYYAGDTNSFNGTMTSLQQFGLVVVDVPTGQSRASTLVSDTLTRANQWVEFKTEGAVDLRFLVPLVFGILALRQLLTRSPGLNTAPWYVMAWYAFDSFIKLNDEGVKFPTAADKGRDPDNNGSGFST